MHLRVPAVKRGGGDTSSARKGELADSRGQEAEASAQQPASEREANGRKGVSEQEAAASGKPMARQENERRRWHNKRQRDNQPANKRQ